MVKFFFSNRTIYKVMRFSEWLKQSRNSVKMSQKILADKVTELGYQITDAQISNYEREYDKDQDGNPTRPKEKFVELAAVVMGRPVSEGREAAGYFTGDSTEAGQLLREIESISPEKRAMAIQVARSAVQPFKDDPDFDFNYIDD